MSKKVYEIVRIKQEVMETMENRYVVRSPECVINHAYQLIGEDDREIFLVMILNTKNQVVAVHRAHVGALNSTVVHPRDVLKGAILNNACSYIAVHQHPSGDPKPSQEDMNVCKRLKDSGDLIGIPLLDFVILGEKSNGTTAFVSLKEKGHL